jgi:hypothetical protein
MSIQFDPRATAIRARRMTTAQYLRSHYATPAARKSTFTHSLAFMAGAAMTLTFYSMYIYSLLGAN